jgi:hypothetical protein
MMKLNKNIQLSEESTLFEYLEEEKKREFAVRIVQTQIANIRRYYINNLMLSLAVIASVCLLFFVQFKVDNLQDKVDMVQAQIHDYEADLKLLEVEWCYLTRPDRLRFLSSKYLEGNVNIAFNQVRNYQKLEQFYLANLKRKEDERASVSVSLLNN